MGPHAGYLIPGLPKGHKAHPSGSHVSHVPKAGHEVRLSVRDAHAPVRCPDAGTTLKTPAVGSDGLIVNTTSTTRATPSRCDIIVDESGELRIVLAGHWDEPEQAKVLRDTLEGLRDFGAPSALDVQDLGQVSSEVQALLSKLGVTSSPNLA